MTKEASKRSTEQVDVPIEPSEEMVAKQVSAEDEDDILASNEALADLGQRISTDDMRRELGL